MIADVLKNFAVWIDGYGYAGNASEVQLPKLTIKSEEYRAAGMDIPVKIDLGMDAMQAMVTLDSFDLVAQAQFGLMPGNLVRMTIRGAITSSDGLVSAAEATLCGTIDEVDPGSWQPGSKAQLKLTLSVRYYELTIDELPVVEIDAENFVRRIGGIDQLAGIRLALNI